MRLWHQLPNLSHRWLDHEQVCGRLKFAFGPVLRMFFVHIPDCHETFYDHYGCLRMDMRIFNPLGSTCGTIQLMLSWMALTVSSVA